ncbi:hypothetical protein COT30_03530 [Candidatus Micrarchaeota archaeon CG08_land_8_20_14_0_20_49_17]|nr:MAG: hypothetical protein AUJ13_03310 [Candidatus Micrarchaeota archaeon CG1_02_49_24]PIU09598.1 MAG: hypothetical protein COT30_03530 [Candidatus Micrarchaeota archaeon CG08_land_8_20_14_0_20_49_17]PIZ95129.1 MAG: hypothetical protein COX84_04625 [Candidatus Micrarchaeota archaeon CG_4_10_14_0_2_um_filter_49_7]HII53967.1 6-carboxytetrahydropterin synthase [Candidatus Micrarchaeota archaeon]
MPSVKIYKVKTISCAHKLGLPYKSKCNEIHGHNYKIEVWAEGELNTEKMVLDYSIIGETIEMYDHKFLNDLFQPATSEMFACELLRELKKRARKANPTAKFIVRVWETGSSYAEATW